MIAPGRFYEIYIAISRHFTADSYDYFKYHGKINVSKDSFLARKDKYWFEKAAFKCVNEAEAVGLCVANTRAGKKYIRNFNFDEYHQWLAYRDALSYKYHAELKKYKERCGVSQVRAIDTLAEMLVNGDLSIEFLILFNQVLGNNWAYQKLDDSGNFLWLSDIKEKVKKYEPFVLTLWEITPEKVIELQKATK